MANNNNNDTGLGTNPDWIGVMKKDMDDATSLWARSGKIPFPIPMT